MSEAEEKELSKNEECEVSIKEEFDLINSPPEYIDSPEEDMSDASLDNKDEVFKEPLKHRTAPKNIECELDFEEESAPDKSSPDKTTTEKISTKIKVEQDYEAEDDGECSEDGELEDGELEDDDTNAKQPANPKQVCRFFHRGQCFYGNLCRFLHLKNDQKDRGNYEMFAPTSKVLRTYPEYETPPTYAPPLMGPRPAPRLGPNFPPMPVPAIPPNAYPEPPPLESAWERGLREAKELVKKANRRKEEEPDFNEKRLNLSLKVNEKVTEVYYNKENTSKPYKKKYEPDPYYPKYDEMAPDENYDFARMQQATNSKSRYENFEVQYMDRRYNRERRPADNFKKSQKGFGRVREDRMQEIQARSRQEEYFDPWRRSKSPKGNKRSRSRSRESYSSLSSYSSKSNRSYSYSRSSSSSSHRSTSVKRKPPSPIGASFAQKATNRFTTIRKKPGSLAKKHSSSRSLSRTPPSRSYSRSLSMSSVSSASSSMSNSSSRSGSVVNDEHASALKQDVKPPPIKVEVDEDLNVYLEERDFEKEMIMVEEEEEIDPLEEEFQNPGYSPSLPFQSLQHLLPNYDDEPAKPKTPIKLTLLNKTSQPNIIEVPKKELEVNSSISKGVKRPASPPLPADTARPAPVSQKKSASSRRDELLKQLKAVEDAIARKRAKFC